MTKRPLLIAIVATWCPTCNQTKPEILRAKDLLKARGIESYLIDADQNAQVINKYNVNEFPTILARLPDGAVRSMPWPEGRLPTAEDIVTFVVKEASIDTRVAASLPVKPAPNCNTGRCGNGPSNIDPAFWGPGTWRLIHSVAQAYPEHPSKADQIKTARFYFSLSEVLPCSTCRSDFQHLMKQSELRLTKQHLASRQALYAWTVALHDAVNKKLGKK